jgi:hypothetical protein
MKEVEMIKKKGFLIPALCFLIGFVPVLSLARPQANPDLAGILGTWNLEVYADGQSILLSLVLEKKDGRPSGTLSEQMGIFTNLPLQNIKLDGDVLTFEVSVASPPDGIERVWTGQLKVADETVEGTISNTEIDISASVSGKREKK